jgi:hypothetical protein
MFARFLRAIAAQYTYTIELSVAKSIAETSKRNIWAEVGGIAKRLTSRFFYKIVDTGVKTCYWRSTTKRGQNAHFYK